MKKLFWAIIAVLVIGSSVTVQAQNSNKQDIKDSQQVQDNFMTSLFEKEIKKSVSNYYKNKVKNSDSVQITYQWSKDDVVEVMQTEKGHVLENSYVIKFTIETYNNGKLGTDTITFGVEPLNQKGKTEVNMLKYDHKAP